MMSWYGWLARRMMGGAEEENDRGVWEELVAAVGEISLDSEDEGFSSGLEA
eukprot:SAG11_NODE_993_length_6261_cov_114.016391_9_plen_51_part_00